jgi:hypothetical protein
VRRWNPLGFRVIELSTEPEVLAPQAVGTGPTPAAGPARAAGDGG